MTERERWLAETEALFARREKMPADTPQRRDLWAMCRALPEQMEHRTFALADIRWLDDLDRYFADRDSKEADGDESHASRIQ